jgi:hypothetical protein
MFYENHTSLIFENVKSDLLSKENFDVDSCSKSKGEGFIVQGRTQQAGSSNKPKSKSSQGIINPTFFVIIAKLITMWSQVKNKERYNKKEADKSSAEASIVENSDGGEALMITSNDEKRMT